VGCSSASARANYEHSRPQMFYAYSYPASTLAFRAYFDTFIKPADFTLASKSEENGAKWKISLCRKAARTGQIANKTDSRKIAEFLSKDGQLLLPFLELLCNTQQAIDELIDVVGKAAVEKRPRFCSLFFCSICYFLP